MEGMQTPYTFMPLGVSDSLYIHYSCLGTSDPPLILALYIHAFIPFDLKSVYFTHPFERASGGALLVLLGNVMNNSMSAHRQVLIKKSGRTI